MNSQLERELEIYSRNMESIEKILIVELRAILEKLSLRLNKNKLIEWDVGMGIERLRISNTDIITNDTEFYKHYHGGKPAYKEVISILNGHFEHNRTLHERTAERFPELKEFYDTIQAVEDIIGVERVCYGMFELRGKRN